MAPMAHPLGLPDSDMLSSRRPRLQVKGHDSSKVTAFLFVLQESSSYRYLIGKIGIRGLRENWLAVVTFGSIHPLLILDIIKS